MFCNYDEIDIKRKISIQLSVEMRDIRSIHNNYSVTHFHRGPSGRNDESFRELSYSLCQAASKSLSGTWEGVVGVVDGC